MTHRVIMHLQSQHIQFELESNAMSSHRHIPVEENSSNQWRMVLGCLVSKGRVMRLIKQPKALLKLSDGIIVEVQTPFQLKAVKP